MPDSAGEAVTVTFPRDVAQAVFNLIEERLRLPPSQSPPLMPEAYNALLVALHPKIRRRTVP